MCKYMHDYKIWNVIRKENRIEIYNLCEMSFCLALFTFSPQMEEIMAAEHQVFKWKKRVAKSKIINGVR
ncbi:hypothetical protein Bca101_005037 [Brassica carinata]